MAERGLCLLHGVQGYGLQATRLGRGKQSLQNNTSLLKPLKLGIACTISSFKD